MHRMDMERPRVNGHRVKWAYVSRMIPDSGAFSVARPPDPPRAGDLVVARIDQIGVHDHLEDRVGRRVRLYQGDLIVGAYGNRYATDFYEGYVPEGTRTHLLTAGGLIGTVASAHDAREEATEVEVLGALATKDGNALSLEAFALPIPPPATRPAGTIAVVGTGMNAGKTTTVSGVIRGWTKAGIAVGAGKVTGSGSGKDTWGYLDAGAIAVADFLDFGMPSTFGYPLERLGQTMLAIRDALVAEHAEQVVLEIADGLLQPETRWLLDRLNFVDAVILAAVDALSAHSGAELLRTYGLPVRAVSGLVARSPLASREASEATGLPVVTPSSLADGGAVELLLPQGAST